MSFFKTVQTDSEAPFNMASLYLMNLNNWIQQKNIYLESENYDGFIKVILIIWQMVEGYISKNKSDDKTKEFSDNLYKTLNLLQNTEVDMVHLQKLLKIDRQLMKYLWQYNFIFPPTVANDPFKSIQKKYDLKMKEQEK